MKCRGSAAVVLLLGLLPAAAEAAATRPVGPGRPYTTPCQAIAAAAAGDTIQIDAAGNGSYDGDVCATRVPNLTIEGVNGRARIDAAGRSSGGKAIWVLSGADTVVRNVELSGATVPDRNGAAIRVEGDGDLTLSASYIHDNQDGILVTGSTNTDVVVERSEFAANGAGDGQSHNIYVSGAHSFTMRHSYSHAARVGHLVKSRAVVNDISYNRLTGENGTGSYELDIPDGGTTRVVGNVIQQGSASENSAMLAYAAESARNPGSQLSVVNNTFVNDRPGNATAVFVGRSMTDPVKVINNISVGQTTLVNQAAAQVGRNCLPGDALFVNRPAFDYHLRQASPCRDAGTPDVPTGLPVEQYVYDLGHEARAVVGGAPDAGAFEWAPIAPGGGVPGAGGSVITLGGRSVKSDGSVRLTLNVSRPGAVTTTATTRSVVYGQAGARANAAGTVVVTLEPTAAGKKALRKRKRLTLSLTIRFRPAGGGAAVTRRAKVAIRRTKAGAQAG
jgi:hypothetical protein